MKTKQLPTNWKEVELGELFTFESKSGKKAGEGSKNGKYKFFTSSSQQSKFIDEYNFEGEHLIFSTGGQAGIHYCNEKFSSSNDCFVVLIKDVLTKYVYYYLRAKLYLLEEGFKGAGLRHLSRNYLSNINIPLPPLQTQKKIVSILEKAEQLKQRREQSDKLTDEYLKSVFNEMFLKEKFEEVEISSGILKTGNKTPEKDFPNKTFNYVDISSIDNKLKRIIETKEILGKDAPSRAKQLIKYKDVLISTVRPNLNSVAMIEKNLDNQICSTGFCILRTDNKKVLPGYLFFISQSHFFVNSLVEKTRGANYPAVSDKDIKSLKIPLPPLTLQKKFANIVEKVEKLKEKQKQSKGEINLMFDALMQKAFKGELV